MIRLSVQGPAAHEWRTDRRLAACAIAAALLLIAAFRHNGHGFYTFLRIYVCGVAAILALSDWRRGMTWLPLSAALIAILFNPLRVIVMQPGSWFWYNVASAAWFIAVAAWPAIRSMSRLSRHAATMAAAFVAIVGVAIYASPGAAGASNTMNVDEDLTTDMNSATAADLNAVANFAAAAGANDNSVQEPGAEEPTGSSSGADDDDSNDD